MARRRKTQARDTLMEPGLDTAIRRSRRTVRKPTPSARPRAAEAKAARRATSRGSSEAQAAAGRGRSRSAEATAAARSEARLAAAGTGRPRGAETRAATLTRRPAGSTPYDIAAGGIPPRVLRRPIDAPYDMLGGPAPGVPRRRTPTAFTPYDELGNQIPARRRTPSTAFDILGGTQDQASIERARLRAWEAEMRRLGHGSRFL